MLKRLAPWLAQMKPWSPRPALGIVLQLLALAAGIGLLALSGWFLSAAAVAGLTAASFNYMLPSAGVRFFALSRTATRYAERLVTHDTTFRLLSKLRRSVYQRLEPLSPAALQRFGESELMTRLTADVDALDALYLRVLTPSIVALLGVVLCGVIIGAFAVPIGVFAALMLLIAGLLGPWLAQRSGRPLSDRWQRYNTAIRTRLLERLGGFSELLLYGRWQPEVDALLDAQRARDDCEYRLARQWGNAQLLSGLMLGLTLSGVLALGAWWSTHHGLDPTLIALMGLAVMGAFEAVAMLPQAWQHLGRIERAAERIEAVEQSVPEIAFPDRGAPPPSGSRLEIEALKVSLDADRSTLEGLDLCIEAGEQLVIQGPSGGGKTTLFNTLVRFVEPDSGDIRLGGVALDAFDEATLRAQFSVAPQETHLFGETFRDNLTMGDPDISDDAIHALLAELGLDEWLAQQPDGLDDYPDERGSSLSGGQLRRFGVARALLRQAPVVLLDEPTEGLDEATEARVLDTIRRRCTGRTLIVITHKPAQLEHFDRVAVLDGGRIIEQGSPQTLLDNPASRLAALQRHFEPTRLFPATG
ncbi:thiol reductant ABC exporter subunit CydC [Kushneria aurantia]|uniref:Thiol reductant ABC exporter subunit CydC n=1 Tax=Kushneria aurantia TaxID=504092 RepID=A0ABV6G2X6_9GAMM|nr:thiol reductant ABC exporter subunit CydC [Kushneria aurantia]